MVGSLMPSPVIFDNPFAFEQPVTFIAVTWPRNVSSDLYPVNDDYSRESVHRVTGKYINVTSASKYVFLFVSVTKNRHLRLLIKYVHHLREINYVKNEINKTERTAVNIDRKSR